MDTSIGAVQVVESVDENIDSGGKSVKKIRTIPCYDGGPSLEKILLDEDVRDLPLLVFCIAGKTRGGKSFLLNLMIKHLEYLERKHFSLESNQCYEADEDWLSGTVPGGFNWSNGIDSVTLGLWIFPKIFRLKDLYENEVGIMLLDTEGMYDGEATDGEIIAMSGISAAISYKQIFNMKEKITGDYLESIVRSLIKGIEELDSEETKLLKEYKLLLVVRDWIGEDKFAFGIEGGKKYIESEKKRGTSENQQLWSTIQDTFRDIDCVLLPNPGKEVLRKTFNSSGDLQMLDDEFLDAVKVFIEDLFHPDNLMPPSTSLTGHDIYRILKNIDGKIADEDLSFLHIFTDHGNFVKVEKWKTNFEDILEDTKSPPQLPEAKVQLFGIIDKAKQTLRGRSRSTYLTDLTNALEGTYNKKVVEIMFLDYKRYFGKYGIEQEHRNRWHDVKRTFQKHICGDNATRQNANLIFMKKSAAHYYNLLHEEHKNKFRYKCNLKKTLDECTGLDEKEIKSFKECEDFFNDSNGKELIYPIFLKEFQSLKKEYVDILLKHISKITGVSEETLKTLRNKQYEHFERFTLLNKDKLNLDSVSKTEEVLIAKKVGYAMFGLPSNTSSESHQGTKLIDSTKTGYSKNQESKIFPVVKKIISLSSDPVQFSCIFVVYEEDKKNKDNKEDKKKDNKKDNKKDKKEEKKEDNKEDNKEDTKEDTKEDNKEDNKEYNKEDNKDDKKEVKICNIPVFRIYGNKVIKYMDSNCRVYTGWDDFQKLNTLPDVFYCYPLKGSYIKEDGFAVAFSKTPASKPSNRVLNMTDKVGKGVNLGAGAAGIAVLGGVAAPAVLGVAVVGSVVGGCYGMFRVGQKIWDKKKHDEPVKFKDYFNFGANLVSVGGAAVMAVGKTAVLATEGALLIGSRVAGALAGVSSLTVLFTVSNDTADLISLIAEVEEILLKILFYFNATSQENAFEVIRDCLKLESDSSKVDTLIALVERNCIECAVETTTGNVTIEKYVSQSTAALVYSIMTSICSETIDIVLHNCDINKILQRYAEGGIKEDQLFEEIMEPMQKLYINLQNEIGTPMAQVSITNLLCQNLEQLSQDPTFIPFIVDMMEKEDSHQLVLAFRYLTCSLIGIIRKANVFFNSIHHEAIPLKYHYLDDISCHPISEVTERVKEILEQVESANDLKTHKNEEFNLILLEVLKLVKQISNNPWTIHQFARCLVNTTNAIVKHSDKVVSKNRELVVERETLSCDNLTELFQDLGFEGTNYGLNLLKKVVNKVTEDLSAMEEVKKNIQGTDNLLVVPAWGGILDNLYCYCSSVPVGENIIQEAFKIKKQNYSWYQCEEEKRTLRVIYPGDIELLSIFVIYSVWQDNKMEWGFILEVKPTSE